MAGSQGFAVKFEVNFVDVLASALMYMPVVLQRQWLKPLAEYQLVSACWLVLGQQSAGGADCSSLLAWQAEAAALW